jgi:hypothetical protein
VSRKEVSGFGKNAPPFAGFTGCTYKPIRRSIMKSRKFRIERNNVLLWMVTTAAGCRPRLDRLNRLPGRLHRNLLDEGVLISKEEPGCLSTPMGEVEVDQFVKALERAVARLRKE